MARPISEEVRQRLAFYNLLALTRGQRGGGSHLKDHRPLNANKTKLLVMGTRQMLQKLPDFHITLLGKEIAPTASAGDLGVQIDAMNSWP